MEEGVTKLQGCPEDYWDKNAIFHETFNVHIHKFLDQLHLMGIFSFNMCAFEEYCRRFKWHDENKAFSKSIQKEFGDNIEALVRELARTPNI